MARIALITTFKAAIEDGNPIRFARVLAGRGDQVSLMSMDTLRMESGRIMIDGADYEPGMIINQPMPALQPIPLDHDFVWVHSLGMRESFLDKIQLLHALPDQCRVINSLEAIMYLKSKYLLAARPEAFNAPDTHVSPDAARLIKCIRDAGGTWIIKPPAGSLGRDVFKVTADDPNLAAILQHLCGPENNRYTMIQRWVPSIEQGEKRVLIAAGEIVDQYQRFAVQDHRTNVSQGARVVHCDLTEPERMLCKQLAQELLRRGAWFAGLDLAFPWLIEVNVISPGGIGTIEELTGVDQSERVVTAVMAAVSGD